MRASDFGFSDDPDEAAREEVRPYVGLTPAERYARFLDFVAFYEEIRRSLDPELRARYERARRLDDPGPWWQRVPRP